MTTWDERIFEESDWMYPRQSFHKASFQASHRQWMAIARYFAEVVFDKRMATTIRQGIITQAVRKSGANWNERREGETVANQRIRMGNDWIERHKDCIGLSFRDGSIAKIEKVIADELWKPFVEANDDANQ